MNASNLKSADLAMMIQTSIKCIATLIPAGTQISILRRPGQKDAYMDIQWPSGCMSSLTIPRYAPTSCAVVSQAISDLFDEMEG
ncbi:hypothetical protein ACNQFN_11320 [Thauera butanivorans]|uniref:hypothetical protein n=1 Tax=Thauera butanivorans TaxID=86174 RepID=UPI003AB709E9